MKQFYFFVMALFLSLGIAANAQAEEFSFTVEWENPGSVTLKKGWSTLSLDPGATSYTYASDNEWAANLVVGAAAGWQLDEAYYMENGEKKSINKNYSGQYSLSLSDYNGQTIKVVTSQVAMDSKVTINVLFTPKAVSEVSFTKTGTKLTSFVKGSQQVEFSSALDSEVTIIATADAWTLDIDGNKAYRRFYSIKKNGVDVSSCWNDFKTLYSVPVVDGDVIEIQPTEVDPNPDVNPEDLIATVSFDFTQAPSGLLKNIFCDGKFYTLADVAEGLKVDKGTQVRVNFNEDYTVTSVTYAGQALECTDSSVKFIVNESGTFVVVAKDKEYATYTYTAYVVCPEGLKVANGNLLSGEYADLSGGEVVNEDIVVTGIEPVETFTIPAGTAKKVTFELRNKYSNAVFTSEEGYWIKAARVWNDMSTPLDGIFDYNKAVLLVAKKIEHDATAQIYIDNEMDPTTVQLRPDKRNGSIENRKFTKTGYNTFTFDSEFEPAFSVTCTDGDFVDYSGSAPKPNYLATVYETSTPVGGEDMTWDSENICYMAKKIADGNLLQVYPSIRKTVKVTRDRFAFADVSVGTGMTPVDLSTPDKATSVKAYSLTDLHFYINPEDTEVWVDDVKQECDENYVKVTVENPHKIAIKYVGEDPTAATFTPAAGSESEDLGEILVSFPNASWVEMAEDKSADEIRFSCGDIWAPIRTEIEAVENASVPTFKISIYPAPTMPYEYSLLIPADFFKFNYTEDCAENDITASFTLKSSSAELSYTFEPYAALNAEYNNWGAWVGVIFNDDQLVQSVDTSKISVKWNGEDVEAEYVMADSQYNMLMVCVTTEEIMNGAEGSLYVKFEEGAAVVNGQSTPEMEHTWLVSLPKEFAYDIPVHHYDLDNNVMTVMVTFPATYETVEVFNENGITLKENSYSGGNYFETGVITKTKPEALRMHAPAYSDDEITEEPGHVFAVTFKAPTKNNSYTLSSRQGTFTINGFQESDEFSKDYDFSEITTGISDLLMDMLSEGKVYNLQGIRQSAKWSELPAGIYIVNGVKTVKK